MYKYATPFSNKAKLPLVIMIIVNNLSLVKYKIIDASSRFFILERISFPETLKSDVMKYHDTLVAVRPDQLYHDFHLEGDLPDD